jgi:hypothetical protein
MPEQQPRLAPPAPFAGNTLSRAVSVDFEEVSALIERVEQETGFEAGSYTVAVIPTVLVRGQLGSQPVDDSFAPAFTMTFSRTQISLDADLARSESRTRPETTARETSVSVLGRPVAVRLARRRACPVPDCTGHDCHASAGTPGQADAAQRCPIRVLIYP